MATDRARLEVSEVQFPGLRTSVEISDVLFSGKSEFQDVRVVRTPTFGKVLLLDGCTQSAEVDEFIYHESLVHPAMLSCARPPASVFIGGGGEGATLREVLRHRSVEKCVMVDIDGVAVDICRKELPEWSAGGFEDPRTELHIGDAVAFLRADERKYDVIVLDVCDPLEAGPAVVCYSVEFYQDIMAHLNEGGVFVTQSGSGSANIATHVFTVVNRTMREVFGTVVPYTADIPSFLMPWAYNVAFAGAGDGAAALPATPAEWDARIAERLPGVALRHLDGAAFAGMAGMSRSVRLALEGEERVSTKANPKAFLQ